MAKKEPQLASRRCSFLALFSLMMSLAGVVTVIGCTLLEQQQQRRHSLSITHIHTPIFFFKESPAKRLSSPRETQSKSGPRRSTFAQVQIQTKSMKLRLKNLLNFEPKIIDFRPIFERFFCRTFGRALTDFQKSSDRFNALLF